MGLDALLDVVQRLGARGSSASAGGNGLGMARATSTAQAASPISRWLRRNREWAIRSCSSGRPEACERGRPSAPDRGLLWRPAPREPCGLRHSHLEHPFHLSSRLLLKLKVCVLTRPQRLRKQQLRVCHVMSRSMGVTSNAADKLTDDASGDVSRSSSSAGSPVGVLKPWSSVPGGGPAGVTDESPILKLSKPSVLT